MLASLPPSRLKQPSPPPPCDGCNTQAVWALGNIAGDSWQARDQVLEAQALPVLIAFVTPMSKLGSLRSTQIRNIAWTLSNLCKRTPPPSSQYSQALVGVVHMLLHYVVRLRAF